MSSRDNARKRLSTSDTTSIPKRPRLCEFGIEVIPFENLPAECTADTLDAEAHRRNFILKHKQRLLVQRKLVLPYKCYFRPEGLFLEWESIGGHPSSSTQPRSSRPAPKGEVKAQETTLCMPLRDAAISSDVINIPGPSSTFPSIASMTIASDSSDESDAQVDELDSDSGELDPQPPTENKQVLPPSKEAGSSFYDPIILSDEEDNTSLPSNCSDEDDESYLVKPTRSRKLQRLSLTPDSDESGAICQRSRCSTPSRLSHGENDTLVGTRPGTPKARSNAPARHVKLLETKHVPVPKNTHARGRRVLLQDKHIVTVSMRGDLQYFDVRNRDREKLLSKPWESGKTHVEDACTVHGYGVIAYDQGPQQVSIVHGTRVVPLGALPHKGGLSCVCPATPGSAINFFSGGHDHTVRLWSVSADEYSATVDQLPLAHSSLVHALVFTPNEQLFTASNCTAILFDVNKHKEVMRGPSSNTIYQLHVQPDQPNILATEVKHLDRQINIYDLRQGFFDKSPVISMGYRDEGPQIGSRYQRGEFRGCLFVRGYHDGSIKLFDIRSAKRGVAAHDLTRREQGVAHTLFWSGSKILAFGGTMLSFLNFQYT